LRRGRRARILGELPVAGAVGGEDAVALLAERDHESTFGAGVGHALRADDAQELLGGVPAGVVAEPLGERVADALAAASLRGLGGLLLAATGARGGRLGLGRGGRDGAHARGFGALGGRAFEAEDD